MKKNIIAVGKHISLRVVEDDKQSNLILPDGKRDERYSHLLVDSVGDDVTIKINIGDEVLCDPRFLTGGYEDKENPENSRIIIPEGAVLCRIEDQADEKDLN